MLSRWILRESATPISTRCFDLFVCGNNTRLKRHFVSVRERDIDRALFSHYMPRIGHGTRAPLRGRAKVVSAKNGYTWPNFLN